MKNAYVSTLLELWGDSDEKLPHSIFLKFAPGPLIRIMRHFQYDPQEPNKKQSRWTLKSVLNRNYLFLIVHVKSFNQTTFSI